MFHWWAEYGRPGLCKAAAVQALCLLQQLREGAQWLQVCQVVPEITWLYSVVNCGKANQKQTSVFFLLVLPSGKRLHDYGKIHHAMKMGRSTISTGPFSIANRLFTRGYHIPWKFYQIPTGTPIDLFSMVQMQPTAGDSSRWCQFGSFFSIPTIPTGDWSRFFWIRRQIVNFSWFFLEWCVQSLTGTASCCWCLSEPLPGPTFQNSAPFYIFYALPKSLSLAWGFQKNFNNKLLLAWQSKLISSGAFL